MSIKPILFNTEMVKAILDGRKTVTRRICKDANDFTVPDMSFCDFNKRTYAVHNYANKTHTDKLSIAERTCPICPGDILYVRETWAEWTGGYVYKAGTPPFAQAGESPVMRWEPSIHMPKEAARIWLRATAVWVERLQDITAEQAEKEGCRGYQTEGKFSVSPVCHFMKIWDSTIKKGDMETYGWAANPWVWVIEFERCDKPELQEV